MFLRHIIIWTFLELCKLKCFCDKNIFNISFCDLVLSLADHGEMLNVRIWNFYGGDFSSFLHNITGKGGRSI